VVNYHEGKKVINFQKKSREGENGVLSLVYGLIENYRTSVSFSIRIGYEKNRPTYLSVAQYGMGVVVTL